MEFQEYDREAAVTDRPGTSLEYYTLGLAGETGEVANKVKKISRDDKGILTEERRAAILDELSDCMWYMSRMAAFRDSDLGQIADLNIAKLRARQANGTIHGSGDKR